MDGDAHVIPGYSLHVKDLPVPIWRPGYLTQEDWDGLGTYLQKAAEIYVDNLLKVPRERRSAWRNKGLAPTGWEATNPQPNTTAGGSGLNVDTGSSGGSVTPTSPLKSSLDNGGLAMSDDRVTHEIPGAMGWEVRRVILAEGLERYDVAQDNLYRLGPLPFNEALAGITRFIEEAESVRDALLDLVTYNRAAEALRAPTASKKGR